ncbi:T9SS type A sorting domain-containing protein [Flavobacterium sp. RHBU_24]|uniref:T9SS type A sorting domain-containing protein n=1 Tax=Flavobacterium sp. RHBU_24 TaxID=3391185 RepID=UPI003984C516
MKKNYLNLAFVFLITSVCFAQQNIDFETAGAGASYTWNVFENDTNPALEFVANPDPSGANISATVAKYTTLITGAPYAGCETSHENGMSDFVLDAAHSTIKIMVYKSIISNVGLKLVTPTGAALPEVKVPNTLVNQWEELTFDFSAQVGFFTEPFDQVVVFPDFSANPRTYGTVSYFDNITFGPAVAPVAPLTAAPDPTLPQAQVISLFSGVYTNVPVDTWLAVWSSAGMQEVQIEGNATKRYTGLNYAGVETIAQQIDITGMDHFNVNVWSADFQQFRIKLVDFGANAAYDGPGQADDKEHEITFNAPAQGGWITYSIPLSDFTGLTTRENIAQVVFSTSGGNTVYVDNVYFSTGEVAATASVNDEIVRLYPNPAGDVLHISAATAIETVVVYNALGQQIINMQVNSNEAVVNVGALTSGIYSISTTGNGGTTVQKFIKR